MGLTGHSIGAHDSRSLTAASDRDLALQIIQFRRDADQQEARPIGHRSARRAFSRAVPGTRRHTVDRHHLKANLRPSTGWTGMLAPVGRAGRGSCRGSIQRRRGHIMVALTRDMRQTSMFSERKDHAYVCRIGWPCWRVTLVAQRATEVTDIPGVPQQPGWVRPEGGAPSEKRASGYEPFDRSAASRARITGRGAGGIGGQHRRRADPR